MATPSLGDGSVQSFDPRYLLLSTYHDNLRLPRHVLPAPPVPAPLLRLPALPRLRGNRDAHPGPRWRGKAGPPRLGTPHYDGRLCVARPRVADHDPFSPSSPPPGPPAVGPACFHLAQASGPGHAPGASVPGFAAAHGGPARAGDRRGGHGQSAPPPLSPH